jgi:hypothetical protein
MRTEGAEKARLVYASQSGLAERRSGRGVAEYRRWYVNIENSEHPSDTLQFHTAKMAHKFEPMKNDLILRTAKGVAETLDISMTHEADNCRPKS